MRKKLAFCFLLLLVALCGTVLAAWFVPPDEPPLRVGMDDMEVDSVLLPWAGLRAGVIRVRDGHSVYDMTPPPWHVHFQQYPDWLGKQSEIIVVIDKDHTLIDWEIKRLPRTRPPWLDRAINAVSW